MNILVRLVEPWENSRRGLIGKLFSAAGANRICSILTLTRLRDMQMLAFLGSKERNLDDYKGLVAKAQPRLQFVGVITPVGSSMSVMEWIYE